MAGYNPKYKVVIISTATSTSYDVTPALLKLTLHENDGEIAQRVSLTLANMKVNGQYLSGIFTVRDRIFVYGNDGEKEEEVFRGFLWQRNYSSKLKKELTFTCYDNLIYFQESEEYQYFSSGYSTKSICGTLCGNWGVQLNYQYISITHPKLPLRGNLANIFLTDVLGEARKKTGVKPVMRSIKDVVHIDSVGMNITIYKLYAGKNGNAIDTDSETTMQGMVTKVIILGKEDDNDRATIETTVTGNTSAYGTLQKVLSSSSTTLAEVKEEANQLIKDKGAPKESFTITAVDIPWIRKGDKVEVRAGDMSGYFIVKSIMHSLNDKTMTIEAEKA